MTWFKENVGLEHEQMDIKQRDTGLVTARDTDATASRPAIRFTIFTKTNGLLTKRLYRDDSQKGFGKDGSLCRMSLGAAEVVTVNSITGVEEVINNLDHDQAIALGVFADGVTQAEIASRAVATGDLRTRTKGGPKGMIFDETGPGLLLIDVDVDHVVDGFDDTAIGVYNTLQRVLPVLDGKAFLGRASTSSGIFYNQVRLDDPLKAGYHLYFIVDNATDVPEVLRRIDMRLWLAGMGRIKISRSGSRLYRTPVDAAVGSPERLIFEAPPVVEGGLEQRERPIYVQDGAYLSLEDFPALNALDLLKIHDLRRREYDAAASEAARVRSAYIDQHSAELAKRLETEAGLSEDEAIRRARRDLNSTENGVLTGCFQLLTEVNFDQEGEAEVTIDQIYAEPHRFDGVYCRDPFNQDKGPQKARVLRRDDGFMTLHAWTHGGADYLLLPSFGGLVQRLEAWSTLDSDARTRLREDCGRADLSAAEQVKIRNALCENGDRKRDIDSILKEVAEQRKALQKNSINSADDELNIQRKDVEKDAPHAVIASDLRDFLRCESIDPIFDQGKVFAFSGGVWSEVPESNLRTVIGLSYRDCHIVRRGSDYASVLRALEDLIHSPGFFDATAPGFAANGVFYSVTAEGEIKNEPLTAEHRQKFVLPFSPDLSTADPGMLGDLLDMVFIPQRRDDYAQSLGALMGTAILGLGRSFKEAGFLIGAGDSGKSTIGALLKLFLPDAAVSAVPLGALNREYSMATLAGKRLNLPGEEAGDIVIPAAALKQITGGDPVNARQPYGRNFSFVPSALQLFTANHMPPLREHEAPIYRRMVFIQFDREVPIEKRIGKTEIAARKMFDQEGPKILGWALDCAARALAKQTMQTEATLSASHEWRQQDDTVLAAFTGADACFVVTGCNDDHLTAKDAYNTYERQTRDAGRKPLGRNNFYARIKTSVDLKRLGVHLDEDRNRFLLLHGVKEANSKSTASYSAAAAVREGMRKIAGAHEDTETRIPQVNL
jgi:P4 family phage/plasmid primase-like protien